MNLFWQTVASPVSKSRPGAPGTRHTVRRDRRGRVQSSRHCSQGFAALHPGLFSLLPYGKNGLSTESGLASKPIYKEIPWCRECDRRGTARWGVAYTQRRIARSEAMSAYPYPNPQAIFYQEYETVRRDEVAGILVALFLGGFGIHHFYLRRTALGVVYLCFFWTPVPWILGFIECFFMPGRV